jgi:hypothetical protein
MGSEKLLIRMGISDVAQFDAGCSFDGGVANAPFY